MTLQQMLVTFLIVALLGTLLPAVDFGAIDRGIEWLAVATMPIWEPLWRPIEAVLFR